MKQVTKMSKYEGIPWCNRYMRPINYELKHSGLPCIEPETNPYLGPRLKCGGCPDQSYKETLDGIEIEGGTALTTFMRGLQTSEDTAEVDERGN